ncbi:MAG: hypothetical protein H7281_00650 [Bacteriovorax sp.]|nr:hypothetical protein [Bacteriovorax sp.]
MKTPNFLKFLTIISLSFAFVACASRPKLYPDETLKSRDKGYQVLGWDSLI